MKFPKTKKQIFFLTLITGLFSYLLFPNITQAATQFQYRLLETFPGFYQQGDVMTNFQDFVLSLYKFGIWTVGIAGLFMLIVGGIMYMGSAGNNSTASSAKGIVTDSIIGIIAALGAYLFLYVINPDLTRINLNFTPVEVSEIEGTPMGSTSCTPLANGNCGIQTLVAFYQSKGSSGDPVNWGNQASAICNGESSGSANAESSTDRCQANGTNDPVSIGLFQINLTVHNVAGLNCPSAFNMPYTSSRDKPNCYVKDRDLYNKCVNAAKNPTSNIVAAYSIYSNKSSWHPWGANTRSNCNFQ